MIWARAVLSLALGVAMPASACTVVWVPYLKHRPTDLYAVTARAAAITFSKRVETAMPWTFEVAGTMRLRGIKCLSKPKGVRNCPTDLDIDFSATQDGASCPFYPASLPPDKPVTDRYFYLRQSDGKWFIVGGARRLAQL